MSRIICGPLQEVDGPEEKLISIDYEIYASRTSQATVPIGLRRDDGTIDLLGSISRYRCIADGGSFNFYEFSSSDRHNGLTTCTSACMIDVLTERYGQHPTTHQLQ